MKQLKAFLPLSILIIDDEPNIAKTFRIFLTSLGNEVDIELGIRPGLAKLEEEVYDILFLDIRLGTENGMSWIQKIQSLAPKTKIIMITAFPGTEEAVECMKLGAFDFISKPFNPELVKKILERISEFKKLENEIKNLKSSEGKLYDLIEIESQNPKMNRMLLLAKQVAKSETSVILLGQSGTGKTTLARSIHEWSERKEFPFAVVSCPTLNPDLLESELFGHAKGAFTGAIKDNSGRVANCDKGTLFLDEIGDLPLNIQSKLLRFLQEKQYERLGESKTRIADVRIITATNRNLDQLVKEGKFREDLYYRINVFPIELVSLKERKEDILSISSFLLKLLSIQNKKVILGFSDEAKNFLLTYEWPGNIRELRNSIERAVILCNQSFIAKEDLSEKNSVASTKSKIGDPVSLEEIKDAHIKAVLLNSNSVQEAARTLEVDQATLWRFRQKHGLL
ncbi:sigma-54 dependent transcriptional regulator [Leptospira sp. 96542]|nr:sigma-54 dependent transcriptional regulator [Leptospira sp. 96542]